MKNFVYKFIYRVRQQANKRPTLATVVSAGRKRSFVAYDWGTDTFVFEQNVWKVKPPRPPVLMVRKNAFIEGREGWIMTITSGSHAVAAIPLLKGEFWNLGRVSDKHRSEVMNKCVICSNVVGDTIEISQRDIATEEIFAADEWLRSLGWSLSNVVLAERNDSALEFYRRKGQEWRIKPLAWSREGMDFALAASRGHIHSDFIYYHSVKGVHFLTYQDFVALIPKCETDIDSVKSCINELAKPSEVGVLPALRDPKFHGHHEIEFFGIRDRNATERIISMVEELARQLDDLTPGILADCLQVIGDFYYDALSFPDLADSSSALFVQSMYRHLTGAIYSSSPDQVVPAFDDRKTALPGVTYRGGKPDFHPGADARTIALIDYVQSLLSEGESLEYLNVYELRLQGAHVPLGRGPTREIDFKTNRRPVSIRLIEKRLAHHGIEYANYMLVRVQAMQSLGIAFGDHHLLARHERKSGEEYYFVRNRYQGFPTTAIGQSHFKRALPDGTFAEFPEAILATAGLIGRAAAHTLIAKKYIPGSNPVHFGEGKEIIEFGYHLDFQCEMPIRVRLCSIRGTLGWPCIDKDKDNLEVCFDSFTEAFAQAIVAFWKKNMRNVTLDAVIARFNEGFVAATKEIYWNYANQRELFYQFDPGIRKIFKFNQKWTFALWALECQYNSLNRLCAMITVASGKLATSPIMATPAETGAPAKDGEKQGPLS